VRSRPAVRPGVFFEPAARRRVTPRILFDLYSIERIARARFDTDSIRTH